MPFTIRKLRNQNLYSVKNIHTGAVHSHHTSKSNAIKQVHLLQAVDHGFVPRGGARINSKVKKMYDYLSSLYPKKTLLFVANEIIKMSKGGGGSRASDIAKYIISAIGIALAVALALFIKESEPRNQNQEHNYRLVPPSYEDLYGPEPSAPPYEKQIGYAYGSDSYSGQSSPSHPVHYREPPSRKGKSTHKIDVLGGKRRRRHKKLY
jgi:hypothetical protein